MLNGRYNYLRVSQMREDERTRAKIVSQVWQQLDGRIGNDTPHPMVPEIVSALSQPPTFKNWTIWIWVYAYGGVSLIRKLTAEGMRPLVPGIAGIPDGEERMGHLLAGEHLTPDVQSYARSKSPRRVLVCFTGNDLRLNVPLQLFHLFAVRWFDRIIYLRDRKRQFFTQGIEGIADDFEGLVQYLLKMIGAVDQLAVIGTSSGGYPAIRFAERAAANRTLLLSPPLTFKGQSAVRGQENLLPSSVRMVYSNNNEMDRRFSAEWSGTQYANQIEWMDIPSHATLWACIRNQQLDTLLSWLSGRTGDGARDAEILQAGAAACP